MDSQEDKRGVISKCLEVRSSGGKKRTNVPAGGGGKKEDMCLLAHGRKQLHRGGACQKTSQEY